MQSFLTNATTRPNDAPKAVEHTLAAHIPLMEISGIRMSMTHPTTKACEQPWFVATDYFTKYVEAEPMATTIQTDIERFIWRNIIYRFGIP
ncbi:hypothetical protein ACFX2I_043364 [Malus domestica]